MEEMALWLLHELGIGGRGLLIQFTEYSIIQYDCNLSMRETGRKKF